MPQPSTRLPIPRVMLVVVLTACLSGCDSLPEVQARVWRPAALQPAAVTLPTPLPSASRPPEGPLPSPPGEADPSSAPSTGASAGAATSPVSGGGAVLSPTAAVGGAIVMQDGGTLPVTGSL